MKINTNQNFDGFFSSLEKPTIAKVLKTIDLLEKFGHQLGMPHSRYVREGLFELRVRGQQEIRIFYCFHNGAAYLLHGFIKKSQKPPQKDLKTAILRLKRLTLV